MKYLSYLGKSLGERKKGGRETVQRCEKMGAECAE